MKKDYVIYKGARYNSGDKINILWYTHGCKNAYNYTGTFVDCDEEKDEYRFIVDGHTYCFNKICFYRTIINEPIQDKNIKNVPRKATMTEELNIEGMLIAWIWYIFIMCIAVIFYGRIGIWILASVVFFNYRRRKLNERGYK